MLRLATRTNRPTAGAWASTPSCPYCTSRALRTPHSPLETQRRQPLDEQYWRKSEHIFAVARLDARAAKGAHREYYRAKRAGTCVEDPDYERHLIRWSNWRAPEATPRRLGPTSSPRAKRHHHQTTRSLHTTPSTRIQSLDDHNVGQLGPGDFVELRLADSPPEYGYLLGTVSQSRDRARKMSGPLREAVRDQTHTLGILDATRLFFLNCKGVVSMANKKDITFRLPFSNLSPTLAKEALDQSALLPSETQALNSGTNSLVPGRGFADTGINEVSAEQQAAYQQRTQICSHMNRFLRQVEIQAEEHRRTLFHLISMPTPKRLEDHYAHLTLAQAATLLDSKTFLPALELDMAVAASPPSPASLLAAHQLLMLQHDYFICDEDAHVNSSIWTLRPERERTALDAVNGWLDEVGWLAQPPPPSSTTTSTTSSSPIYSFIDTATKAIRTGGNVTWSDNDKVILGVLLDCFASSRMIQPDIYRHIVATVLKAFNHIAPLIPGTCDSVFYTRFKDDDWKREAGVLSSLNASLLAFVKSLKIFPEHVTDWSLLSGAAKRVLESALLRRQKLLSAAKDGSLPQPPSEDLEAHIRTPFDEDVFIIDDATARELDDGVSISEPSEPDGRTWVHVHVADPTCTLTPDETIAKDARRQSESLYFHNTTLPLLAGRKFSGVAEKSSLGPAKVLTFSALIDDQGMCHDINIMPRTITKQHIMTYEDVDEIVTDEQSAHPHARKLQGLARVAKFMQRRRARDGGFLASSAQLKVDLKPNAQNQGAMTPSGQLPFYVPSPLALADPTIMALVNDNNWVPPMYGAKEHSIDLTYSATELTQDAGQAARDLVAEFMIMAGRVAAAWSYRAVDGAQAAEQSLRLQRAGDPSSKLDITPTTWSNQPVALPYRVQLFPEQLHDRWARELSKLCDEEGRVEWRAILEKGILPDAGSLRAHPAQHMSMGIGSSRAGIYDASTGRLLTRTGRQGSKPRDLFDGCGYARMTSPLRRYSDLLGHWQVKAILHRAFPRTAQDDVALQEALERRRNTLVSKEQLASVVQSTYHGDQLVKRLENNSTKHWGLKAIRLELERAGLQQSTEPEPTPGRPGKNGHAPPHVPPEQGPSSTGGITLASPPGSPISSLILSSAIPAYVTDPMVVPEADSMRNYVKIRIPSLGIAGVYPITQYTSAEILRTVQKRFTYIPPRPDHPLEVKAGGKYLGLEGPGDLEGFVMNEIRVGKVFPVRLNFVSEGVVGGTVLAGSVYDRTQDDAKAKTVPGTFMGTSATGLTL